MRKFLIHAVIWIVAAACLEVGTRVFFMREPALLYANNVLTNFSPELGWFHNPGAVNSVRTRYGKTVTYRINTQGFRGGETTSPAVLFVGDSFTFGTDEDVTFPDEYSKLTGRPVINAGIPGYGTDQALLMARHVIEKMGIRPQCIVYTLYTNDIQNNVTRLNIHANEGDIVHKPIIDPKSLRYLPARIEENNVTSRLQGSIMPVLRRSDFFAKAERALAMVSRGGRPPRFDKEAGVYLNANLDAFTYPLTILHISHSWKSPVDDAIEANLKPRGNYLRPKFTDADFLNQGRGHLSAKGAKKVAKILKERACQHLR